MRNTPESRACGILHGNCTRKCRCWQARRCDDWKNARALDVDVETMRCPDIQMRNFSTIDLHFTVSTMKIRDRKPVFLCRNMRLSKEHERGRGDTMEEVLRNLNKEMGVTGSAIVSKGTGQIRTCLLYTSDAADDLLCVDLG